MESDMRRRFSIFWAFCVRLVTELLPDGAVTERLRGVLYGFCMKKRGKNFRVASGVRISGLNNVTVGRDVFIGCDTTILASTDVLLEDEVMLGHKVMIVTGNHTLKDGSYRYGAFNRAPVVVRKGSWVGALCTLLPGVTVGRGTAVGANSVVTKDVPDDCVAAGVPARVIKYTRECGPQNEE